MRTPAILTTKINWVTSFALCAILVIFVVPRSTDAQIITRFGKTHPRNICHIPPSNYQMGDRSRTVSAGPANMPPLAVRRVSNRSLIKKSVGVAEQQTACSRLD